ncbi:Hypothetical protein FKW44_013289, partial [Caligus rogercresseyi]
HIHYGPPIPEPVPSGYGFPFSSEYEIADDPLPTYGKPSAPYIEDSPSPAPPTYFI